MERIAIEAKDINKHISNELALNNINITVHASEIVCITGPKGCGKSLLMKALIKLVNVESGSIFYFNHDIKKERNYIMNFVGFKAYEFTPWKNLSVIDYFKYSQEFYAGDFTSNILELLDYFHLSSKAKLRSLSYEDLQKVNIIDSLFFNPEVIIMNEPMLGLTKDTESLLISLLYSLRKKGKAILVTSTNLKDARFADRVILMEKGSLKEDVDSSKLSNYKKVFVKFKKEIDGSTFNDSKFKNLVIDQAGASFIYTGEINELVHLLDKTGIVDLTVESPSLEEIYKVLE